jgi:predicted outer membrane protein
MFPTLENVSVLFAWRARVMRSTLQHHPRTRRLTMNTHIRLPLAAIALAVLAAGCNRNPDNAVDTTTPATPATVTAPADTTMPAPTSTMASPSTTTMPAGTTMPDAAQSADNGFLSDASRSNEEEIAVTALAMGEGGANVKPVATMLNKDHTALRDKLNSASPSAPTAPMATAPADLSALSGKDFDTRVLSMLRDSHEKGIAKYTEASQNMALSEGVRTLATQTLPTLKNHLEQVKAAQAKE